MKLLQLKLIEVEVQNVGDDAIIVELSNKVMNYKQ
jgi:hypothetical protein